MKLKSFFAALVFAVLTAAEMNSIAKLEKNKRNSTY